MLFALELTVVEMHLDKPAIDLRKRSPVEGAVSDGGWRGILRLRKLVGQLTIRLLLGRQSNKLHDIFLYLYRVAC